MCAMPEYEPGLDLAQYEAVSAAILELARAKGGPFDENDALLAAFSSGASENAGTVAALLEDLTGAGFLRKLPGSDPRWELVEESGPGSPGG